MTTYRDGLDTAPSLCWGCFTHYSPIPSSIAYQRARRQSARPLASTNSGSGEVAVPFFEQSAGMPRRDLLDDASRDQFVSNCAPRPLADRAPCFQRGFTRESCHLTALFRCELGRRSRSGRILQALGQTQSLQIDALQSDPAVSPSLRTT